MSSKNDINAYINEVKDYKVLTRQEEQELVLKMKAGDENSREKLINHNLKLVISIAKTRLAEVKGPNNLTLEELINEGNKGLIIAIDRYDLNHGSKIATYATYWINEYIKIFINNSLTKFKQLSLDQPLTDQSEGTLLDLIPSEASDDDEIENEISGAIDELLNCLNEREKNMVLMRAGYGYEKSYSYVEMSRIYNLSSERIRQIVKMALGKVAKCEAAKKYYYLIDAFLKKN